MKKKKTDKKKNRKILKDYTPDILHSEGANDQIFAAISAEFGRDKAREYMGRW